MAALLTNPNIDFLVVSDILPDRLPQDVIGTVKKDPRMANCKIAILCKDEEAAKARLGDGYTYIKAPLTGEALEAAAKAALDGVADPANARAEAYAAMASSSLAAMANGRSDIGGALAALAGQLYRADAVSVPAAKAIGLAGGEAALPALSAALAGGEEGLGVFGAGLEMGPLLREKAGEDGALLRFGPPAREPAEGVVDQRHGRRRRALRRHCEEAARGEAGRGAEREARPARDGRARAAVGEVVG
jgi:hypothetical protein